MPTVAKPRQRVKPARTYAVLQPPTEGNPSVVVRVTEGKVVDDYLVRAIPSDWGDAFEVRKVSGPEADRNAYHVHLDRQGQTCECLGFLRWQHCRHLELLPQLAEAGHLPNATAWPEDYPAWSAALDAALPAQPPF